MNTENNLGKVLMKFKKLKYISKHFFLVLILTPQFSYAENYEEAVLSIQNKIKEYELKIEKDVSENQTEEKRASEGFSKDDMSKKAKMNDLNLANTKLDKEIEEKINKSQQLEKTIAELKEQNKEEIKRNKEKQKRDKANNDTQKAITKQWQENRSEINSILATIVDSSAESKIKCIIEARVNGDGLVSDALVVKPSVFGLFDSIAQRTIMEAGYINLPDGVSTVKIVFTKNSAIMKIDDK
jgi:hypothetical protein